MNTELETAELHAQIAELQHIVSAQADTITKERKELSGYRAHSEIMLLRAKKAEEELVQLKAGVMAANALSQPAGVVK